MLAIAAKKIKYFLNSGSVCIEENENVSNLVKAARSIHSGVRGTKPLFYYDRYSEFLNFIKLDPTKIVEIGTFEGESTKIFSRAFPRAKILTIDKDKRDIDFTMFPNVKYCIGDQQNPESIITQVASTFSGEVDLIIDDASHLGGLSKKTFDALFPILKNSGAYFIEDWGTGYWQNWPDGMPRQTFEVDPDNSLMPRRIPSHDAGMVGFVKSLVDLTHQGIIKDDFLKIDRSLSRINILQFSEGLCLIQKAI